MIDSTNRIGGAQNTPSLPLDKEIAPSSKKTKAGAVPLMTLVEESKSPQGMAKTSLPKEGVVMVTLPSPKKVSTPLAQVFGRFAETAQSSGFNFLAIAKLMMKTIMMSYRSARKERQADLSAQVTSLQAKSEDIRKEATMQLVSGAISGAAEMGAGLVQGVGGAKALKAMRGTENMNAASAASQSTQMRFTAVSDGITATGKMGSAGANYGETQYKADETEDETQATREGAYVSETSEDMQNLRNMRDSALQEIRAQIDTRHEAAEKSLY